MKPNRHKISHEDKRAIQAALKEALEQHREVSFGYVHGSFVTEKEFADIDVAVYLNEMPESPLEYEIDLESLLQNCVVPYAVDVRVLNGAPLSFRYNVIKNGIPIIVRDDDRRADFQEATLAEYFDFAPYRSMYLKETLGLGV